MMVMNFLEWFETCPAWQAVVVSLAGIAVIMAVEKLVARLLQPAPGQASALSGRAQALEFTQVAGYDGTVPAT